MFPKDSHFGDAAKMDTCFSGMAQSGKKRAAKVKIKVLIGGSKATFCTHLQDAG